MTNADEYETVLHHPKTSPPMDLTKTYINIAGPEDTWKEVPEATLGYAAALLDGEGCINISSRRRPSSVNPSYSLAVIISNNDRRIVDWLQALWGGRIHSRRGSHHVAFQWRVDGVRAEKFIVDVMPHLVIKGEQANHAGFFQEHMRASHYDRSPEAIAMRETYKQQMHALKKKYFEPAGMVA